MVSCSDIARINDLAPLLQWVVVTFLSNLFTERELIWKSVQAVSYEQYGGSKPHHCSVRWWPSFTHLFTFTIRPEGLMVTSLCCPWSLKVWHYPETFSFYTPLPQCKIHPVKTLLTQPHNTRSCLSGRQHCVHLYLYGLLLAADSFCLSPKCVLTFTLHFVILLYHLPGAHCLQS